MQILEERFECIYLCTVYTHTHLFIYLRRHVIYVDMYLYICLFMYLIEKACDISYDSPGGLICILNVCSKCEEDVIKLFIAGYSTWHF